MGMFFLYDGVHILHTRDHGSVLMHEILEQVILPTAKGEMPWIGEFQ